MIKNLFALLLCMCTCAGFTQSARQHDAAEILVRLKKFNFLGSVLYVAAHPDDENTRLIAYLENDRYARVAYLALTRGDGGQNLIGPEIREALGVIRTQELLSARRIDGGEQFFTRANDFGYSKNAEETLEIWDREKVLADVVRTYRRFRPDVIITRFPPDERAGHGHHTSSAILAGEAFEISGKQGAYPDQLETYTPWQPRRLFINTGRWWNPDMSGDEAGVLTVDVGAYNPLLGESMTEIAARSRSQHKSQGFGVSGSRGEELEFLEFVKGDQAEEDIFEGVDTSWSRVEGGATIGEDVTAIISAYDPEDPAASVPALLQVRDQITTLEDEFWKNIKLKELDGILSAMTGLYMEANAAEWRVYPGQETSLNFEVTNRSKLPVKLTRVTVDGKELIPDQVLGENGQWTSEVTYAIPGDAAFSNPYWLEETGTLGMYRIADPEMIGLPENPPAMEAVVYVIIGGTEISYSIPVIHKWNDPVNGEQRRPLVIAPPAVVTIPTPVFLFPSGESRIIDVEVTNYLEDTPAQVSLTAEDGWKIEPAVRMVDGLKPGETGTVQFSVTPPREENTAILKAMVEVDGKKYSRSQVSILYDHFPAQTLLPEATARLVNIPIRKYGHEIGYIQGAGDAIPETLQELGYEVRELQDQDITLENLQAMDAVILGVRALNTNEGISSYMDDLLAYVERGGTLIVQYNTNFRLKTNDFAPYPLTLSRQRVASENAPVEILARDHPVINEPNVILQSDFDGWVQERGLYFPESWDQAYTPILSSHDPGEPALDGGLLVANYGKGYYIYTGYSWFRELPAGVPGAIKLFTNLVSLGKGQSTSDRNGQ